MGEASGGIEPTRSLRVFLSYSRRDGEFTARLAHALSERGFLADFDRSTHDKENIETGISAEDDWWQRLQQMILAADAIVFIVSPDSAASRVCDEEIAYARTMGKRVIAILRRPIDFSTAPPRLAALNVKIDATADDAAGFDECVVALSGALNRDVTWLREQTRLQQAARDWMQSGERDEELLRGGEIVEAEAWLACKPFNVIDISEELVTFLNASRLGQAKRDELERQALARQRRLQTWVGGLVAIALIITLAGGAFVVERQRSVARSQSLTLARSVELHLQRNDFEGALRLAVLSARDTFLSPASPEARVALASASASSPLLASFVGHEGAVTGSALSPDETHVLSWSRDGTTRIWAASTGALVKAHQHGHEVVGARFFANGTRVVSWDRGGGVHLFGVSDDGVAAPAPMRFDHAINDVAVSLDERLLFISIAAGEGENYSLPQIVVRRVADGAAHGAPIVLRRAGALAFTPDGRRVLITTSEYAQIFDVATLEPVSAQMRHQGETWGSRISPDGTRVLTFSGAMVGGTPSDNAARLWDLETGAPIGAPLQHSRSILDAKFDADGRRVITMGRDAMARVWDAQTGAPLTPMLSHAGPINAETPDEPWTVWNAGIHDADFSPDGTLLATTGSDQRLRVWRLDAGGAPYIAARMQAWAHSVRFSADGARVLTLDQRGEIRSWNLVTGQTEDSPIPAHAFFDRIVFSSHRQRALTWADDGSMALWDLEANRARSPAMAHDEIVDEASWLGGGGVSARSADGQIRLWDASGAQIGAAINHPNLLGAAASPNGSRILSWGSNGDVRQWRRDTHASAARSINVGSPVIRVLHVGDGRRLATVDWSKRVRLWDADSGAEIGTGVSVPSTIPELFAANQNRGVSYNLLAMFGLQSSPDGSRILSWANGDAAVQLDAQTGAAIGAPMAHLNLVTGATYSPDGATIATWSGQSAAANGATENSVRLWDREGRSLGDPLAHAAAVRGAVFSSDGAHLLSWTEQGQVLVWNVGARDLAFTLQHVAPRPSGNTGFVVGASFTPDGRQIMSWGDDGVKIWDRAGGTQIGRALDSNSTVVTAVFSPDGRYILTTEQIGALGAKITIWDVATHLPITAQGEGAGITYGASWRADGQAVLTWGEDRAARIWLQPWMTHSEGLNAWAGEICDAKLRGRAIERQGADGATWIGVRRISAEDAALAPILRGREGEDVCAWRPAWYDRVLDFLLGWMA